jgi:GT2 family glycosyltransferase
MTLNGLGNALQSARTTPTVSVVVTARNEGELLNRTIERIRATVASDTEIVVVDDWSSDGSTDAIARAGDLRLLRPPHELGVTGARNFGAAAARGEVLVFSDAHVAPNSGWLPPLLDALKDPAVGVAAPVVSALGREEDKGYGFTWRNPSLTMHWLRWSGAADPYEVPFLCGCFLALRRECFERVGGFDEGLRKWGSEDAELSLRMWLLGLECRVVPGSDIAHLFRPKFPYKVRWANTLHNTLRIATLHLGEESLARVIEHHASFPGFAKAYARLISGDVWAVREHIHSIRRYDGDWFVERFAIDALR